MKRTLANERGAALGIEPAKRDKTARLWAQTPMIVAVVSSPKPAAKVPEVEQILSAGAVCLSLVNAAEAMGWGASWLTGWHAVDRPCRGGSAVRGHHHRIGVVVGKRIVEPGLDEP